MKKDTKIDRCSYKNDIKLKGISQKLVDNYVETGDFLKSFVHACHF